jgi:hypothetical protein
MFPYGYDTWNTLGENYYNTHALAGCQHSLGMIPLITNTLTSYSLQVDVTHSRSWLISLLADSFIDFFGLLRVRFFTQSMA